MKSELKVPHMGSSDYWGEASDPTLNAVLHMIYFLGRLKYNMFFQITRKFELRTQWSINMFGRIWNVRFKARSVEDVKLLINIWMNYFGIIVVLWGPIWQKGLLIKKLISVIVKGDIISVPNQVWKWEHLQNLFCCISYIVYFETFWRRNLKFGIITESCILNIDIIKNKIF